MSLAIRLYDPLDYSSTQSVIYFSATTSFNRVYSNTNPKHPVDKDADISDHSSPNNAEYSISGIVSEVDISSNTSYISYQIGAPVTNESNHPEAVRMNDSFGGGGLIGGLVSKFVPDFLSQFFGGSVDIVVDERGKGWSVTDVREAIINATRGKRWNEDLERNETYPLYVEIIVLDKLGNLKEKVDKAFLIDSFSDNQDENTGDALFFDLKLTESRQSKLKTTTVDSGKTKDGVENTTAGKKNAGKQSTDKLSDDEVSKVESEVGVTQRKTGLGRVLKKETTDGNG